MSPEYKSSFRINSLVMHRIIAGSPAQFDDVDSNTLRFIMDIPEVCFSTIDSALDGSIKGDMVCLTFDDGYSSDRDIVLPMLLESGAHATFFVVTDWINKPWFLNASQIREIYDAGMQVGSHSHTHPNLLSLDSDKIDHELVASRQILEDILGDKVTTFSFPYGYDNSVVTEAVFRAGYSYCCTSRHGLLSQYSSIIPRNSINGAMSLHDVSRVVKAGMLTRARWKVEDISKLGLKRYCPGFYYSIRSFIAGK